MARSAPSSTLFDRYRKWRASYGLLVTELDQTQFAAQMQFAGSLPTSSENSSLAFMRRSKPKIGTPRALSKVRHVLADFHRRPCATVLHARVTIPIAARNYDVALMIAEVILRGHAAPRLQSLKCACGPHRLLRLAGTCFLVERRRKY